MQGFWKKIKCSTRTAKFGMVCIVLWALCALLAPVLSPYGPNDVDISSRFIPPAWNEKGSTEHLLGTDEMGRDVLSRLIYGSRISMLVGFSSVVIGLILGLNRAPP